MKPLLVLTTVGGDFDPSPLAIELVERQLAACVNIIDRVRSVYRWEGTVQKDSEQLLLIKTSEARLEELRSELLRLHPYDIPELVVIDIASTSDAYGAWFLQSLAK